MEQDPALPRWQPTCFAGQAHLHFDTDSVELQAWLSCQPVLPAVGAVGDNRTRVLQLWADETLLLAQWPLEQLRPDHSRLARVGGRAPLAQPAGQARRRLALKLVGGETGTWDRVHDCQRLVLPHRFLQPRLTGVVRASLEADQLRLAIDGISNPRAAGELSGTLALELWALQPPYEGGPFQGQPLGSVTLGCLGGQQQWSALCPSWHWPSTPLPPASQRGQLTLMLREWSPGAYVTRDWRQLAWPGQPDDEPAVSLNRSTTARLRALPGVSERLAHRLVASRPFASLEQLQRVRGISDGLYGRLRDRLVL